MRFAREPVRALLAVVCAWTAIPAFGGDNANALRRFIGEAVDANPQVLAAQARLDTGNALALAAQQSFDNPELSFDVENGEARVRVVELSKTLDLRGKRRARWSVAQAERLAWAADYRRVRQAVALDLLGGLANFLALQERSLLSDRRLELMGQFAAFAERRYEAGDLSLVELDLAILASVDAQLSKAIVAAALAEARGHLLAMLSPAQSESSWPRFDAQLPELATEAVNVQAILHLPEVEAAHRRVAAAEAEVALRRKEIRPDPTVGFAAGKEGEDGLIAVNVSMPIPILNRGGHQVSAASARLVEARRQADDARYRARARLLAAAEHYRAMRAAWRDWARLGRVSLDRKSELLERLWSAGEIGSEEYLVQLEQTLEVRGDAMELRYATWRAWFEWLVASGGMDDWLMRGGE